MAAGASYPLGESRDIVLNHLGLGSIACPALNMLTQRTKRVEQGTTAASQPRRAPVDWLAVSRASKVRF